MCPVGGVFKISTHRWRSESTVAMREDGYPLGRRKERVPPPQPIRGLK